MALRPRWSWPTPENYVAGLKLDAIGFATLCIALGVSGVILGLMLRVISG